MLRAVMHALVASSLAAGPPADPGRTYEGSQEVEAADAQAIVPAPGEASPTQPPPTTAPATSEPAPPKPEPIVAGDPMLPVAEDPTPEGPQDEPDEIPYDPLVDSPEAIRARSWVRSGAIFTGIGGVLLIGAIAMSTAKVNSLDMQGVCSPRGDPAGNGCQEGARNRAVAALGIPGGLLLVGGITMIAVGKVQQKRLRTSLRVSRQELFVGLQMAF